MNYLLDTHALLWWATNSPRLSPGARGVMADPANVLFWSAASSWEVAIKYQLGKLPLPDPPTSYLPGLLASNSVQSLPINDAHALYVADLPRHHQDPFDRLLVAQATLERMILLTNDPLIRRYPVGVAW